MRQGFVRETEDGKTTKKTTKLTKKTRAAAKKMATVRKTRTWFRTG